MDTIEKKEIRGLNLKTLYWIVASSAAMIFTVLFTYFSILGRLNAIEIQKTENDKYNDLRIRTLDLKVSALEVQLDKIESKVLDKP